MSAGAPRARYVLTERAESDLREARHWSRARWGKKLTSQYFADLHAGALFIAEHQKARQKRPDLGAGTDLMVHAVREHYLVYEPLAERLIAIVAVVRQGRDIAAIVEKWSVPIRRELVEIRAKIARGEIRVPTASGGKYRRRK